MKPLINQLLRVSALCLQDQPPLSVGGELRAVDWGPMLQCMVFVWFIFFTDALTRRAG
jgi:hypothetical protein